MARNPQIKEYSLKDGSKRFMFKFYLGTDPLTGKPLSTTRRGFKSIKEARDEMKSLSIEVNTGVYKKQQRETYQDIYDVWVEEYENTVEESTFVKTIGIFKNHILPLMGNNKIDKIDVVACQKHVNVWSKKLKKFRMVKHYASKVLNYAMKHNYIHKNPFSLVEMPKPKLTIDLDEDDSENFYEREELIALLEGIKHSHTHMVYTLFHLLAFSGMRPCIDLEGY